MAAATQRRRRARRAGVAVALLVLLAAPLVWAGWQLAQARQDLLVTAAALEQARSEVARGETPDVALPLAGSASRSAREHTDDPLVRLISRVPGLGRPVQTVRSVATSADLTVNAALRPLVDAAGPDPAAELLAAPGRVDIGYLSRLAPVSAAATSALEGAQRALAEAPAASRIGRVDAARDDFADRLDQLHDAVQTLSLVADVGPALLGADAPRRYLVIPQNPAEARGTGGLPGGYALLEVDKGAVEVLRTGSNSELRPQGRSVIDLGEEFRYHYAHNDPTTFWSNSNISPHFPYAGQIWKALWESQYGGTIDGALTIDPIALSYLLEATGPVAGPAGVRIDAGNVVDLTLRDAYARFDGADEARDAFLQGVSAAVLEALTEQQVPPAELTEALAQAVDERRLLLWVADPALQQELATTAIAGALPANARAVGTTVLNAGANKLDYYLQRSFTYTPACGEGQSRVELVLHNTAPASGLPPYTTSTPELLGDNPVGTNKSIVTLYLPPGSQVAEFSVDGEAMVPRTGRELGLTWAEAFVTLRPGQSVQIMTTFTEPPPATADVVRIAQPLVRPEAYEVVPCSSTQADR